MSSDKCLIGKMLKELKTVRSSIKKQNAAIADVLDKSNNALLQFEASKSLKTYANDNFTAYTHSKEMVNDLTRIVDKSVNLLNISDPTAENPNFDEYLDLVEQRADYFGCNIRKLLATWDTVQEMRTALEQQELDFNSENESDVEEDFLRKSVFEN